MLFKERKEIRCMRESADILSRMHGEVAVFIKPGASTKELDSIAESFILKNGGKPSFKGYMGFPATLCISVNHQVVHGTPDDYVLQDGDIVSIDAGVFYKGYHSDCAFTHKVGNVKKELVNLLSVTKEALDEGIAKVTTRNRIGDIGHAIQSCAVKNNLGVVREYGGHGIGKDLHEDPAIPNFGRRGNGARIREGMVLAIEPIFVLGSVELEYNGAWGVATRDLQPCAHFEHTVAVVEGKAEKLTTFDYIKEAI